MDEPRHRGALTYASFGLVGLLAALLPITKIAEDDFFWHLATGRFIVEHRMVPDRDVFGYATAGRPWIPFEWAWDVLIYLFYLPWGSYVPIQLVATAVWLAISMLLLTSMARLRVPTAVVVTVMGLALVVSVNRMTPRPHLVTLLGLAFIVHAVLSSRREPSKRSLAILPVVFVLWANFHPGVVAGVFLLVVVVAAEALNRIVWKSGKLLRATAVVLAASSIAVLVNPHGLRTFTYAHAHVRMELLASIQEWVPPLEAPSDFRIARVYLVALVLGAAGLFASYRRRDFLPGLVYLAFALYSLRAVRFLADFAVVTAVGTAMGLEDLVRVSPGWLERLARGWRAALGAALVLGALVASVPTNLLHAVLRDHRRFGFGVDSAYFSEGLVWFLKSNRIRGTPFNQFEIGGRLIWEIPGERNFIDSRNLDDEIVREYLSIMGMEPGFEAKLERYGVDYVVLHSPDFRATAANMAGTLIPYLTAARDRWRLVYWDDLSFLYLRNVPKFEPVIARWEYRVLHPYLFAYDPITFDALRRAMPAVFEQEMDRKLREEPEGTLIRFMTRGAARAVRPPLFFAGLLVPDDPESRARR